MAITRTNIKFCLVFLALILSISAVYALECNYVGEKIGSSYCSANLGLLPLKTDGVSCQNNFECFNGSCLEGTCSGGFESEVAAKRGLLEMILAAIQGQATGAKQMNATAPITFTAQEIGVSTSSPLRSVKIKAKSAATAAVSASDLGTNKPSIVDTNPPGIAYRYLELATYQNIEDKIDSAEINFRIPQSWFSSNSADSSKVDMYRWAGSSWTKLTVTKEGSTGEYFDYTAVSPGFSIFAITALSALTQSQQPNVQPTCTDGIQNQDETGVDCGGSCNACSALCGNGIEEAGENCKSCALDVSCEEGEICKYNKCVNKPFPFWTVFIIALVVVIAGFVSFKKISAAGEARKRDLARLSGAISYSTGLLRSGEKDDNIRNNLLKAGWSQKQVSLSLSEAKKQTKPVKAVKK